MKDVHFQVVWQNNYCHKFCHRNSKKTQLNYFHCKWTWFLSTPKYMLWNIWRIKRSFPDLTGPSSQETSSSKTIKNSCGAKDTTQALSGAESTCGKEVFALAITLTCNYWKKKKKKELKILQDLIKIKTNL